MFPFGSILTEVPLIIMAAAYMIYFGFCALNKSNELQNDTTYEISEQTVSYEKTVITTGKQIFYYYDFSSLNKDITSVDSEEEKFIKPLLTYFFTIRDKIVSTRILAFHLFSRPPPVI